MSELEADEVEGKRRRVSLRLWDWRAERFMVVLDFGEIRTVGDFLERVQAMFPALSLDDNQILVLEPDIIVTDISAIHKNDLLLITTHAHLH